MRQTKRFLYVIAGWLCIALGALGAFLPILPTTPFILLAAFCFSRGSETLHQWLLDHPRFGKFVQQWEEHKVIPTRAKWLSIVTMLCTMAYPLFFIELPTYSIALIALTMVGVPSFILSCPSSVEAARHRQACTGEPKSIS